MKTTIISMLFCFCWLSCFCQPHSSVLSNIVARDGGKYERKIIDSLMVKDSDYSKKRTFYWVEELKNGLSIHDNKKGIYSIASSDISQMKYVLFLDKKSDYINILPLSSNENEYVFGVINSINEMDLSYRERYFYFSKLIDKGDYTRYYCRGKMPEKQCVENDSLLRYDLQEKLSKYDIKNVSNSFLKNLIIDSMRVHENCQIGYENNCSIVVTELLKDNTVNDNVFGIYKIGISTTPNSDYLLLADSEKDVYRLYPCKELFYTESENYHSLINRKQYGGKRTLLNDVCMFMDSTSHPLSDSLKYNYIQAINYLCDYSLPEVLEAVPMIDNYSEWERLCSFNASNSTLDYFITRQDDGYANYIFGTIDSLKNDSPRSPYNSRRYLYSFELNKGIPLDNGEWGVYLIGIDERQYNYILLADKQNDYKELFEISNGTQYLPHIIDFLNKHNGAYDERYQYITKLINGCIPENEILAFIYYVEKYSPYSTNCYTKMPGKDSIPEWKKKFDVNNVLDSVLKKRIIDSVKVLEYCNNGYEKECNIFVREILRNNSINDNDFGIYRVSVSFLPSRDHLLIFDRYNDFFTIYSMDNEFSLYLVEENKHEYGERYVLQNVIRCLERSDTLLSAKEKYLYISKIDQLYRYNLDKYKGKKHKRVFTQ